MFVLDSDGALPPRLRGGAAAIGNFDGVHLGHQSVIDGARSRARANGAPLLVVTFDPHPAHFFQPQKPPFALTTRAQKLEILRDLGVDAVAVIPFTPELAALTPAEFAGEWLSTRLGVSHAVTGEDFTFGKKRSGNVQTLAALGQRFGYAAETVAPVRDCGEVISSTRIRAALAAGDVATATRLLTRPFAVRAPVIHGDKRGRTIGVPTTNQLLGGYVRPKYGVYAVRVRVPDGGTLAGVANLGVRPMFTPPRELLETWILDWSGDLYGAEIDVELIAWLRPEVRFDGLPELKAQIERDAVAARQALSGSAAGAA